MVLATHAVVGASVAGLIPGWPAAFLVGVFSHFLLDALPHWDYQLSSYRRDKDHALGYIELGRAFLFDLGRLALDSFLGLALVVWFLVPLAGHTAALWAGVVGGLLPDFLQFVYFRWPSPILKMIQTGHQLIHTPYRLRGPWAAAGVLSQVGLILPLLFLAAGG